MDSTLLNYFAAGFGALASLLLGIAVTQLRALAKTQTGHGEKLIRIETVLTGARGDNGINGDVRQLKEWRRDLEDAALVHRVTELERRHGPDDRRAVG